MTKAASLYLDAVRFLAAISVFAFHLFQPGVADFANLGFHLNIGRAAVMVFFVLSGFVIAYVFDAKERTAESYLISRFARLYSVVIPALILTLFLDHLGRHLDGRHYTASFYDEIPVRMIFSLLFLNQIWNFTVAAFSNAPYWSVAYEFWYYMLFAAAVFSSGYRRYILVLLIVLCVGPRIILMSPLWFLGMGAYYISRKNAATLNRFYWLFPFSIAALLIIHFGYNPGKIASDAFLSMLDGNRFLHVMGSRLFIGGDYEMPSDLLYGLIFAASIITSGPFFSRFQEIPALSKVIRFTASYTFSMYLYHFPLLLFFQAMLRTDATSAPQVMLLSGAVIAMVFMIGHFTERRKNIYVRLFTVLFRRGKRLLQKYGFPAASLKDTEEPA